LNYFVQFAEEQIGGLREDEADFEVFDREVAVGAVAALLGGEPRGSVNDQTVFRADDGEEGSKGGGDFVEMIGADGYAEFAGEADDGRFAEAGAGPEEAVGFTGGEGDEIGCGGGALKVTGG